MGGGLRVEYFSPVGKFRDDLAMALIIGGPRVELGYRLAPSHTEVAIGCFMSSLGNCTIHLFVVVLIVARRFHGIMVFVVLVPRSPIV
ncbi:hypothetical protein HAX54_020616 [Datura stramonium]|uniref:Uncharacterized protein n=1 Tax=Datura stramonium TaxID=4076 RepID=A0ABS8US92_DATST|nr:hypothetical protein [Datura stramonium]